MTRLGDAPESTGEPKVRAEQDSTGLTLYHDSWPVELGEDWTPLLEFFGFDPERFEVEDDSVKVGKWQQSKGHKDGSRDVVWLYSYRARFRRRTAADDALDLGLEEAAVQVRKWKPRRTTTKTTSGAPVTFVHHQGDEQTGKAEGGGLDGLAEREAATLQRSLDRLTELLKAGHNVEAILDLSAGDRVENIVGHYASQPRTTATLRKQLKFARDMDLARTKAFAWFGLPIIKAYTPSNHGEIRPGLSMSPTTSESDNLDLVIAESVKDVLEAAGYSEQVQFLIPHDEWLTRVTTSGVNIGLTHGHKAGSKPILKWVTDQAAYWHRHHDFRIDIIATGHLHHGHVEDAGGMWLIQPSALDGGSPYFEALAGQKAAGGALTYLVGEHLPWKWSNLCPV
ncbi:MAG: hypothetical protein ABW143_02540 [Acidimicrobiales bacterium]